MKKVPCLNCAEQIFETAKFCTFCGTPQAGQVEVKTDPEPAAKTSAPAAACVACGSETDVGSNGLCLDCFAMAQAMSKGPTEEISETSVPSSNRVEDPASSPADTSIKEKPKNSRSKQKLVDQVDTGELKPEAKVADEVLPRETVAKTPIEPPTVTRKKSRLPLVIGGSLAALGLMVLAGSITSAILGSNPSIPDQSSSETPSSQGTKPFQISMALNEQQQVNLSSENCRNFKNLLVSYFDQDVYFKRSDGLQEVNTKKEAKEFYSTNAAWMKLPSYQETFKNNVTMFAGELVIENLPSDFTNGTYELDTMMIGEDFRPILVNTCDTDRFYEATSSALKSFDEDIQRVISLSE